MSSICYQRADVAAAPLYVTKPRSDVIDFSIPFMSVQASLLMHRAKYGYLDPPLKRAGDLLTQNLFAYGTLQTGFLVKAFKNTNVTAYRAIWRNMNALRSEDDVFLSTNDAGIEKVRKENFVFILPSTIAEYMAAQEPCDLVVIDQFLVSKQFALALPKGSTLMKDINRGLTELKQSGTLRRLYAKWWIHKSTCLQQNGGVKSANIMLGNSNSACVHSCMYSIVLVVIFKNVFCVR